MIPWRPTREASLFRKALLFAIFGSVLPLPCSPSLGHRCAATHGQDPAVFLDLCLGLKSPPEFRENGFLSPPRWTQFACNLDRFINPHSFTQQMLACHVPGMALGAAATAGTRYERRGRRSAELGQIVPSQRVGRVALGRWRSGPCPPEGWARCHPPSSLWLPPSRTGF